MGKLGWREKWKGEIKRRCLDRVSGDVFEDFSPISEEESFGDSLGFSLCVPAVPSSVPLVTVLFSNVNVFGEAVFFLIRIGTC